MQRTLKQVRFARFAIPVVTSMITLSMGACSSSNDAKSPESPAPASAGVKASASGLVTSVSGNTIQVAQGTEKFTVDIGRSARIIEFTKAQLADVTAGNCIRLVSMPGSANDGPAAAKTVQLTLPGGDGKCSQPKTSSPDRSVDGTVASVEGNIINVTFTDANGNPAQIAVASTDATSYTKNSLTTSQAIEQGKCIAFQGTKGADGTVQATLVSFRSSDKGKC